MRDPQEQRRQRRAVAAVLAGAVALGVLGIGASVLLGRGPCDDLLPPSFTAPPAVGDGGDVIASVSSPSEAPAIAQATVRAGEVLGFGPVRGATAGDADARTFPVDDAVFVVADERHVRLLDTALVTVATGRERPPATRVVRAGAHLAMVQRDLTEDVLVARYDEDLTLTSCRRLDPPGTVVGLSQGATLVARGDTVEASDVTGRRLWSTASPAGTPTVDAATTGLLAVLASDDAVAAVDLRTGEPRWRVERAQLGDALTDDPILLAGDDVVVVATRSAVVRLAGDDGRVLGSDAVVTPATAATATGRDVVVAAGEELLRIPGAGDATRVRLPGTVTGDLVARGGDVLVVTDAGLALAPAAGDVRVADGLPVASVGVSGVYTVVGVDVGEGFLAFYGPASAG